jgi:hypothetical protein
MYRLKSYREETRKQLFTKGFDVNCLEILVVFVGDFVLY